MCRSPYLKVLTVFKTGLQAAVIKLPFAEKEGFEPPDPFTDRRFSRPVQSARLCHFSFLCRYWDSNPSSSLNLVRLRTTYLKLVYLTTFVTSVGFEPTTSRSVAERSIQLSYEAIKKPFKFNSKGFHYNLLYDYYEYSNRASLTFDERLDELELDIVIIVFIILYIKMFFFCFSKYTNKYLNGKNFIYIFWERGFEVKLPHCWEVNYIPNCSISK